MGIGYVILILVASMCFQSCYTVYKMFQAPPCPAKSSPSSVEEAYCYRPLFRAPSGTVVSDPGESQETIKNGAADDETGDFVDFHVFLTDQAWVKWWDKSGFETDLKHWFSQKNVPFGKEFEVPKVPVPLKELFPSIRANETGPLRAHVYMVRNKNDVKSGSGEDEELRGGILEAGILPPKNVSSIGTTVHRHDAEKKHTYEDLTRFFATPKQSVVDREGGLLSEDIVHASGLMTMAIPKKLRKIRRNLLTGKSWVRKERGGNETEETRKNATGEKNATGGDGEDEEDGGTAPTKEEEEEEEFEKQLMGKYVQKTFTPIIPGVFAKKVTVTDDVRAVSWQLPFLDAAGASHSVDSLWWWSSLFSEVTVYPEDSLMWFATLFLSTGFLNPSYKLSVVRGVAGVLAAGFLFLHQEIQAEEKRQMVLREKDRRQKFLNDLDSSERKNFQADEDGAGSEKRGMFDVLSGRNAPPVPHLIPVLNLQLPLDQREYDAGFIPPLLAVEITVDKRTKQPKEKFTRYSVVGDSGTPSGKKESNPRYSPTLEVDHLGVLQKHYRPLSEDPSTKDPNVTVRLSTVQMWRYSMNRIMRTSMKFYQKNMGLTTRDTEEIQEVLFRHPVHILILMQVGGVGSMQVGGVIRFMEYSMNRIMRYSIVME